MTPVSSWDKPLAAKFLLADGATGTNLFSKGLTTGHAPELWNIENTKKIGELRSACFSPEFQCCLGIAMVDISEQNFSSTCNLSIDGREIMTEMTKLPFIK